MDLLNRCTTKELQLLESIGISVENRDYSVDEVRRMENQIGEHIMSRSSKNGDISKVNNQFNSIINTLIRAERA